MINKHFKTHIHISDRVVGVVLISLAAVTAAFSNVLARVMKNIDYSLLLVWHGFIGLVLSLSYIVLEAIYNYQPKDGKLEFSITKLNMN